MPVVGADGKAIDPSAYPVNTPTEAGGMLAGLPAATAQLAAHTLPGMAAQIGGEYAGGAVGALAPPPFEAVTVPLGAAIGAGLANVGAKHLPESAGGEPNRSNTSAFLWGAVPTGLGRTPAMIARLRSLGQLDPATEKILADYEKELSKSSASGLEQTKAKIKPQAATAGDVAEVRRALGAPTGRVVQPADAASRAARTFPLRDAILGPINRMRRAFGEPLGQAYEALKGQTTPLSEQETADLAEAAQGVRDGLISPAPKTASIFNKIKTWLPKPGIGAQPGGTAVDVGGGTLEDMEAWSHGELVSRAPPTPEALKLQGYNDKQIEKIMGQPGKPPTLDEIRELRQYVNEKLRTAGGGDVHALLNLQHKLDDVLVPHLPDNWSELRQHYKSFSDQFKYQSINQLRGAQDPVAAARWLFGRPQQESFIREVVTHANPQEKQMLRQGFNNFILSGMDDNLPGSKQFAALSKKLQPYIRNGTISELFGGQAASEVTQRLYLPMHYDELVRRLGTPQGEQMFNLGFRQAAATNPDMMQNAAAGYQAFFDSLPAEDRAALQKLGHTGPQGPFVGEVPKPLPATGTPEMRQLAGREVLGQSLARSERSASQSAGGGQRALTYTAVGALMGHPIAVVMGGARVVSKAGNVTKRALINLALKTGTGDKLIKLWTAHPREAGQALYSFLAAVGTQVGQGAFPAQPEPVEGVPSGS